MAIEPQDFVHFAEQVAATDEAGMRAAVSRAYYGAFHGTLRFEQALPSGGIPSREEGMHGMLYQRLLAPTIAKEDRRHAVSRRLGVMGQQLHALRIRADYRLNDTISEGDRDQAILQARKILELAA